MNVRQFAKQLGVTHPAILKAIKTGRLARSVTRDARGQVVDIAPELGAEEWKNGKGRHSTAELRGEKGAGERQSTRPRSQVDVGKGVSRRLTAIVAADLDEIRGLVLALVPYAVEGAIEALRKAGLAPTTEELSDALCLDLGEDEAIDVSCALTAIFDEAHSREVAVDAARQAGRAAVAWRCRGEEGRQ